MATEIFLMLTEAVNILSLWFHAVLRLYSYPESGESPKEVVCYEIWIIYVQGRKNENKNP